MTEHQWNPGELLKLSGGYWATCALHAGVKLDVFSTIGSEALTENAIAEKIDADPRGLAMLLNALTAMALLQKKAETFLNTDISLNFLSITSPKYIGHMILHHHQLMESWARLDEGVKTGKPVRSRKSRDDEKWRESFLMGMFNMAMQMAPLIVPQIDLSGRNHLLDLGGGPGTYAIHFCKHNPNLNATVYDLPTTRPFAEKTIEKFGLSDRIAFNDVDFIQEEIEGTYDAVWLSHILHGESPENCRQIIEKAVSALATGGMIIIHEFILDNTMDGPLFPALFSLNMLLGTEGGQSYSEDQLHEMLTGAGVKDIRRIPVNTPNDSGIIAGTR
jgi:O-methyltransferase/methyltransferase family protein